MSGNETYRLTRRQLLAGAGALAGTAILGGCGLGPQPAPPTPTAVSFAGRKFTATLHVTVWSEYVRDELLKEFKDKYNLSSAEVEVLPPEVIFPRQDTELTGGGGNYNVMWLSFIYAQRYQRAKWMSPLDDYVAKAGADWDFNDLLSGAVTPFRAEGKLWAIPVFADSTMVVYRKDILEKAGIKEFPKTYADMEAMLKQIHNKDGVAAFAVPTFPAMGQMGFYVPAFIQAFGGEQYKDIAKGDYTPNYESPEVIEGVETFARWVKDFSPPGGANVQGAGVVTMMSASKAAVCILSTGAVGRIMDPTASQLTDKFAFASWPKAKVQAAAAAFHGLMIPASAKDKDLAWEFIKWGSSKEILKRTAMNKSYPGVTRQSIFNDPDFKKNYNWGNGDFGRIYAESINLADMRYRTLAFAGPIGDELSKSVSAVIAGQKTTAQAMKEMNAKARDIITGEGFKLS